MDDAKLVSDAIGWILRIERVDKADYHGLLGVERNCSVDDVRDAFRGVARKFHPDLFISVMTSMQHERLTKAYACVANAYAYLSGRSKARSTIEPTVGPTTAGPAVGRAATRQPSAARTAIGLPSVAPTVSRTATGLPSVAPTVSRTATGMPSPAPAAVRGSSDQTQTQNSMPTVVRGSSDSARTQSGMPAVARTATVVPPASPAAAATPDPATASSTVVRASSAGGPPIDTNVMNAKAAPHYRKADQAYRRGDTINAQLHLKMAIAADPQSEYLRNVLKEMSGT